MSSTTKNVKIYTDGACSGNPGPGGWAAVLMFGEHDKELSGFEADTTNNRMELLAAIKGLEALNVPCQVDLYSDSAYLVSAFNQGWLDRWQRNGWKNAAKQEVSNKDLWEQLLSLAKKHSITWHKVKGHSDNEYNNRCDFLAVEAIKKAQSQSGVPTSTNLHEEIISDEQVFSGKVIDVHRYNVKLCDESLSVREIIRHAGGAVIVAVTDDNEVLFVSQFRLATNQLMLELPAGKLDHNEDPLDCAKRELKEETGYTAKRWTKLISYYTSPGFSDEVLHIYLAQELKPGQQNLDPGEFLNVMTLTWDSALEAIHYQAEVDGKTALGVLLACAHLQNRKETNDV